MKLKFWKKDVPKDETILEVTESDATTAVMTQRQFYVKAQTSDKALELMKKLKEK